MKTPEDIKKALECQGVNLLHHLPCSGCAYHERFLPPCRQAAHEDALNYIKYLEERISKQDALLAVMGITIPEDNDDENP